jgi:hypothetical protein
MKKSLMERIKSVREQPKYNKRQPTLEQVAFIKECRNNKQVISYGNMEKIWFDETGELIGYSTWRRMHLYDIK